MYVSDDRVRVENRWWVRRAVGAAIESGASVVASFFEPWALRCMVEGLRGAAAPAGFRPCLENRRRQFVPRPLRRGRRDAGIAASSPPFGIPRPPPYRPRLSTYPSLLFPPPAVRRRTASGKPRTAASRGERRTATLLLPVFRSFSALFKPRRVVVSCVHLY